MIRTAAAMHGATGWIMAVELDDSVPRCDHSDTILTSGRYAAALDHIDCEGCAAAVEAAVQTIRGVRMAGVTKNSSVLVFEIAEKAAVPLSDVEETLSTVGEALRTSITMNHLRGPMPAMFSAA